MRKIRHFLVLGAGALIFAGILLYMFQERLIFLPTKLPESYTYSFEHSFEEFNLETPDLARLNALHFKVMNPKGVILYFHGNAGDLSRWGEVVSIFPSQGYDVIVMDYRTYGKSTGKLSQEALLEDADRFYEHTKTMYPENDIILYGRSIGSGLASYLASKHSPRQVILESPFYSLEAIAKKRFPILPISKLLRYNLTSYQYLQKLRAPISILHGDEDKVIPISSGRKLFDAIPVSSKTFFRIAGGGHNDLNAFSEFHEALFESLKAQAPVE
ncbi:MAG: lysophospholipase [Bacteroidia bacterium]|nr:lysophospholipase [Bacteroidia bacterium]